MSGNNKTNRHHCVPPARLLWIISVALTITACQNNHAVKSHVVLDNNGQADPAYSALTRQESEETLRRLDKIRSNLEQNRKEYYSGPTRHIWDRIRAGRQIEYEDNLRIEEQATYLLRDRDYVNRVSRRTAPFIHFILEEIDKRGLPSELALLPVIESAYRPTATSRSRAVGLWQFILPTSKHLGMKKNWWYDARRDVVSSTRKALDYLEMLNAKFDGDWLLALAAYNGGHGKVRKAIEQNRKTGKPTDYWNLALPKETRNYVPRFLAASRIYTRPEDYGVELYAVPNRPYFATLTIDNQLDIKLASKMARISHADFRTLNAGFLRWATPPNGTHRLAIPLDKVEQFKQELARLPDQEKVRWHKHTIRHGETLTSIALKYNVSVSLLKKTNRLDSPLIRSGSKLLVPLGSNKPSTRTTRVSYSRDGGFYVVQTGDTLWGIARQHQITVDKLLAWNKLDFKSVIKPGQRLRIRSADKEIALRTTGS